MEIQYNHFDVCDYTESEFYLEEAKLYQNEVLQLIQRKDQEIDYLREELNQTKEELRQTEEKLKQTKERLFNLAKKLKVQGLSTDEITTVTGLSAEEISAL
jgi:5-bromo-4-chloroindolyl phosphate hydrolysis protein